MTGLLVSVRSADEAEAALAGGADLIDVKEPHNGSLGRASASVLREVAEVVAGRAPLSCALGELGEVIDDETIDVLKQYDYAKIGLAGAMLLGDWRTRWSKALRRLPAGVRSVAVIYADGAQNNAPPDSEILVCAGRLSCVAALVDTFRKDGRSLLDHWAPQQVERFVKTVRKMGMQPVLAGALQGDALRIAASLSPEYVAVRSAVCQGDRASQIDTQLVRKVVGELAISRPGLARPIFVEEAKKTLDEFA